MRRNDARHTTPPTLLPAAALATAALLLAGCSGGAEPPAEEPAADRPGATAPAFPSPTADVAPAQASACTDGVVVEWQGTPVEKKLFTAIAVSRVGGAGKIAVPYSWDREENGSVRVPKDATDAQRAVVEDAEAGGLIVVQGPPTLADPHELLVGKDEGLYVQYSYARHLTQDAVVSCADGGGTVEVGWTSFETTETGLAPCTAEPDPVVEYVAVEAIRTYCERA